MHNLLREPCIHVSLYGGDRALFSLPEVFAALARSEIKAFTHLQPHQSHAWHAFLVQLGTLAWLQVDEKEYPADKDTWLTLLKSLTTDFPDESPWTLIVEDLAKPAFLQPPVPEGSLKTFEEDIFTPDALDILGKSKNVELKRERIQFPATDHWIFALLNLQTMQGYSGVSNHGISRMNGAYGSRPYVGYTPSLGENEGKKRDMRILVKRRREALLKNLESKDKKLLWLDPWNGMSSLDFDALDSYYVEICRRIRFVKSANGLSVFRTTTEVSRIHSKELKGVTDDPWTPIHTGEETKSLSVDGTGFSYKRCSNLLDTKEYTPGICQQIDSDDPLLLYLSMQVTARGQGKTAGFHERTLFLPKKIRYSLSNPEGKQRLAELSKRNLEDVREVSKALENALYRLFQNGKSEIDREKKNPACWEELYEDRVDQNFFPFLWEQVEMEPETARKHWLEKLEALARSVLQLAITHISVKKHGYYRAVARAERTFQYQISLIIPKREDSHAR